MSPHLVFGGASIGASTNGKTSPWDTAERVQELLDSLKRLGVLEIDSAGSYPPSNAGHTETLLGQTRAVEQGFLIDSKVGVGEGRRLDFDNIHKSLTRTLELLGTDKIRTLYPHTFDKHTPLEDTALGFHKQFVAGGVERLGFCNHYPPDVAKYFDICDAKGFVKPVVYQGQYNLLRRQAEEELIPILRKHGCAFYIYMPLAAGFLSGKVTQARESGDSSTLVGTRWHGESQLQVLLDLYDKPAIHDAVRQLNAACAAESPPVTLQEASLRWLMHHSALRDGDGIIFGASSLDHLETNVLSFKGGSLSEALVQAIDKAWNSIQESEKK